MSLSPATSPVLLACLILASPLAQAGTRYPVPAEDLTLSDGGFRDQATVNGNRFIVLTSLWPDMYGSSWCRPGSIGVWICAIPAPGGRVEPSATQNVRGRSGTLTAITEEPLVEQSHVFSYQVARHDIAHATLSLALSSPGSEVADEYVIRVGDFVRDTPPPIDPTGLELRTRSTLSEDDSTYVLEITCGLVNAGAEPRALWAVSRIREAYVHCSPDSTATGEPANDGEVVTVFPWIDAETRGRIEIDWGLDERVDLLPGAERIGKFRIVYRRFPKTEYGDPVELRARVEVDCRLPDDPDHYTRVRTLSSEVRVALLRDRSPGGGTR